MIAFPGAKRFHKKTSNSHATPGTRLATIAFRAFALLALSLAGQALADNRLSNISTRGLVQTADNVMIGGLIIEGTADKTVMIRARGPSMASVGVTGTLADPMVQLFDAVGMLMETNDNWGDHPLAGSMPSHLVPTEASESAILRTLAPGAYTAIVSGVGGVTGRGIVEVFEVDQTSRLANISTRGQVQTGDDVMIGGLIIEGDTDKTVVIRGRGPSLGDAGVPGVLADPLLQLFSGATQIDVNDNFADHDRVSEIPTALVPTYANEAVIVATLAPGGYTAIVSGVGATSGVGIVEIFEIDDGSTASSSTVAMTGDVASFPETETPTGSSLPRRGDDHNQSQFTQADMRGVRALVSLFLLTDTNKEDAITTVRSLDDGSYEVTAADVRTWLLAKGHITANSTDEDIITAFKALGQLQVSAVIVKRKPDGTERALSIQTIADPNSDERVRINPIVHRVVKAVLDQIVSAIGTLTELGLDEEVVKNLARNVVAEVANEIIAALEEAEDSILEIPEGQNADDIFEGFEEDFEVEADESELAALKETIEKEEDVTEDDLLALGDNVIRARNVDGENDSAGGLSGEEAGSSRRVGAELTGKLLDEVDGLDDSAFTNQAAADAADAGKRIARREELQKFFLAMGFSVVVAQNEEEDTVVIMTTLPTPQHIPRDLLPGRRAFEERGLRYFKIGDGTIEGPFADAQTLGEEVAGKLGGLDQTSLDEILSRAPTQEEFDLLDRLHLYEDLLRRIENNPVVSAELTDFVLDNRDATIPVRKIAAVVADNFEWVQELVSVTNDGFPIFTGTIVPVSGGADVEATQVARFMSLQLADNPGDAARALTANVQFFSQFAPEAIEIALQGAHAGGIDRPFGEILAEVYPESIAGYRELILGNRAAGIPPSPPYDEARDRVARGLTAGFPRELFGTVITPDTTINIRPAFFLLNYLIRNDFTIDPADGFFTGLDIDGQTRLRPNFENIKRLEGADGLTLAAFTAQLLDSSEVQESDAFLMALERIGDLADALPRRPEYEEQNLDDFDDFLGDVVDTVAVSCSVERFDGLNAVDPFGDGSTQEALTVKVFPVEFDDRTGDFFKGDEVARATDGTVTDVEGRSLVTYELTGIPALDGDVRGREFILQFDIPSYQNPIPELFFYVDGFDDHIEVCGAEHPWFVGPDEVFVPVPGIGLVNDQTRPDASGNDAPEGVDLSNMEVPGGLVWLTQDEVDRGEGMVDFRLISTATGFSLAADDITNAGGFAPLFGQFGPNGVDVTLMETVDSEPLFGIYTVLGSNVRAALSELADDELVLSQSIDIPYPDGEVPSERLYLMRDAEGRFWILELRYIEFFEDDTGTVHAFVDLGFAGVNAVGEVMLSEPEFDVGVPDEHVDRRFYFMGLGDWVVLDPPTGYEGPDWLPPQIFAYDEGDYDTLRGAHDGIVIRYAGDYFTDNIVSLEDFDQLFEQGDFSDVPVRLDGVSDNVRFVKLSFQKDLRRYVLSPDPDHATRSARNLRHGDVVAIFDANEPAEGPRWLARILRNAPPGSPDANFSISVEVVPFRSADGADAARVACFFEDDGECPSELPPIFYAEDLENQRGVVFDRDSDGVPGVFDKNDNDPHVPGAPGGEQPRGPGGDEGLSFEPAIEQLDGTAANLILARTHAVYPGDIDTVSLRSADLFGDEVMHLFFRCRAAESTTGAFSGAVCATGDDVGEVRFVEGFQSLDGVGFGLLLAPGVAAQTPRVFLEYEVTFNQPLNPDGTPVSCGEADCEARPPIRGDALIPLVDPTGVELFRNIAIGTGNESPLPVDRLTTIDVTRDLLLTTSPIRGAEEYIIEVFCPGNDDPVNYQDDEFVSFFAPAFDASGRPVAPQFELPLQHLGGRTCDIELIALVFDDAGEVVASITESLENVVLSGGNSAGGDGGFADNELTLSSPEMVCLVDGIVTKQGCTSENMMFFLEGVPFPPLDGGDDLQGLLLLGENVDLAFFESPTRELTGGRLEPGAVVQFDLNLATAGRPSCGVISTDELSDFCPDDIQLTDVLMRVGDRLVLAPALASVFTIEGDVDSEGFISLTDFGRYAIVGPGGFELIEFGIDVFDDGVYLFARPTPDIAEYDREDPNANPLMPIRSPGFLFVQMVGQDQPVDFDVLAVRPAGVKLAWFLPPPRRELVGDHDLDGDGVIDVSVTDVEGIFNFTFADDLPVRRFSPATGELDDVIEDVLVDRGEVFVEFEIDLGDSTWLFFVTGLDGEPHVEFFELSDLSHTPADPFAPEDPEVCVISAGTTGECPEPGDSCDEPNAAGDCEDGTHCDPSVDDCPEPHCDPLTEDCPEPDCDPNEEDCGPAHCDPEQEECPEPDCDPNEEDCGPAHCDPTQEECPEPNCDANGENCGPTHCDPTQEDCPEPDCDPNEEDCGPAHCDPEHEDCPEPNCDANGENCEPAHCDPELEECPEPNCDANGENCGPAHCDPTQEECPEPNCDANGENCGPTHCDPTQEECPEPNCDANGENCGPTHCDPTQEDCPEPDCDPNEEDCGPAHCDPEHEDCPEPDCDPNEEDCGPAHCDPTQEECPEPNCDANGENCEPAHCDPELEECPEPNCDANGENCEPAHCDPELEECPEPTCDPETEDCPAPDCDPDAETCPDPNGDDSGDGTGD